MSGACEYLKWTMHPLYDALIQAAKLDWHIQKASW